MDFIAASVFFSSSPSASSKGVFALCFLCPDRLICPIGLWFCCYISHAPIVKTPTTSIRDMGKNPCVSRVSGACPIYGETRRRYDGEQTLGVAKLFLRILMAKCTHDSHTYRPIGDSKIRECCRECGDVRNWAVRVIVGLVIVIALIAGAINSCGGDDSTPTRNTRTTSIRSDYAPIRSDYAPSRMSKDAAERMCAQLHGVPKWWRPDRDYHNCVDRNS